MKRIHLLSPQLANQIAAGEVVERPAAVLKELLENSIDAGATHIEIDIEKGGSQLIRIRDNGIGIHPDDLALALNRHATSKISTLFDLDAIKSLGFRGEALASISSVSQLTLISRVRGTPNAFKVGHDMSCLYSPAAHPEGTTVEVYNLFYNTPARRRFLRTEHTEFGHIEEVFKRIALSHYAIGFTLKHNQKIIKQYRPALTDSARTQRAAAIFGHNFMNNALAIDNQASETMRLWGWIALPTFSRNHTDLQYCYVNNRMIRDKVIHHAIRLAYQDALPPGRFPAFIMYLIIDPSVVDVNVHPTKHEVRFHESRQIHDFLFSSIRSVIAKEPAAEAIQSHHYKTGLLRHARNGPLREPASPVYTPTTPPPPTPPIDTAIRHILSTEPDGHMTVDMAAARRQCIAAHLNNPEESEPLLMPEIITIDSLGEKSFIPTEEKLCLLRQLNIEVSYLNSTQIIIRKIPKLLKKVKLSRLIPALCATHTLDTAIDCIAAHVADTISTSLIIELSV
ncbi:MAG: DNA mismatch repair endonuclease MutL [Gammaproteobacteria bacterium]